jgi:hypothetical protein
MMLREYIRERIEKNKLPLDLDHTSSHSILYKEKNDNCEYIGFFRYLLNLVGGAINDINPDYAELFGLLQIKKAKQSQMIYYRWLSEEDYYEWLNIRKDVYTNLNNENKRILNFIELSTLEFLSDIKSNTKYKLTNNSGHIIFNKNGYTASILKNGSFIKYLSNQYMQGYTFEVLE